MKLKLNKIIVVFVSVVLLTGGPVTRVSGIASAETSIYTFANCPEIMDTFMKWRIIEFGGFLDVHFASKENNSSLVEAAITGYREFKRLAQRELSKFEISSSGLVYTETEFQNYDLCLNLTDKYIQDAKSMLKQKILTSGRVKQSTVLLEKYKAINKRLGEMNMLVAKIVASYETFYNKLPGYLRDCVKK